MPAPVPFWLNNSLLLWLVTRVVGGVLLAMLVVAGLLLLADPEPVLDPGNRTWADGMGDGVMMGLFWVWGLAADFFGSLPLLVLLTPTLRRALQAPTAPARRWVLFSSLAEWQLLPGLALAARYGASRHDSAVFLGCLGVTLLYLAVTLVVARLLYAPWLANQHLPATDIR